MTKHWEMIEDDARRLLSNDLSLEKVRQQLAKKYNFNACTRSWRLKIKEWGVQKQRQSTTHSDALEVSHPCIEYSVLPSQCEPQEDDCSDREGTDTRNLERASVRHSMLHHTMAPEALAGTPFPSSVNPRIANDELYSRLFDAESAEMRRILGDANFVHGTENFLHHVAGNPFAPERIVRAVIDHMAGNGYPMTVRDGKGRTALQVALEANNERATFLLINADKTLVEMEPSNDSLLHIAIRRGSVRACLRLIPHALDVNKEDLYELTPLELAARKSYNSVVWTLLNAGARFREKPNEWTMLRLWDTYHDCKLPLHTCICMLEEGVLSGLSEDEIRLLCRTYVRKTMSISGYKGLKFESDLCVRALQVLRHILETHMAVLLDQENEPMFFLKFQQFIEGWGCLSRQDTSRNVAGDCLRAVLQHGFKPCSKGLYPYTNHKVLTHPLELAYIYAEACVDTCDLSIYGADMFDHLASLLETPMSLADSSRIVDILETFFSRDPNLNHGINPISHVLMKIPEVHAKRKVQLLKTLIDNKAYSPLNQCSRYGHPLDLLTQAPESSRWRLADIILTADSLTKILPGDQPLEHANLDLYRSKTFKANLESYTSAPAILQRCILHVLTKRIMDGLCVDVSSKSYAQFLEVLAIRREFDLPDLESTIDGNGTISLKKT